MVTLVACFSPDGRVISCIVTAWTYTVNTHTHTAHKHIQTHQWFNQTGLTWEKKSDRRLICLWGYLSPFPASLIFNSCLSLQFFPIVYVCVFGSVVTTEFLCAAPLHTTLCFQKSFKNTRIAEEADTSTFKGFPLPLLLTLLLQAHVAQWGSVTDADCIHNVSKFVYPPLLLLFFFLEIICLQCITPALRLYQKLLLGAERTTSQRSAVNKLDSHRSNLELQSV